jgi:hypothetical protein
VKNKASGLAGTLRGEQGAEQGSGENARRDLADDLPQDGAVPMMFTEAGQRGEQDRRHRRAERKMQDLGRGERRLRSEHQGQRRDHHQPAADAEHAGEETGKQA